ncbi:MAG: 3'(2'),5'-bisphosphate nucleotidase CysQ [Deltaproteobacteria bacterium]|nr:3'(2'),5'-bisphosphate nucleotidase CysQ [Deltaproteobacteria bacterium]
MNGSFDLELRVAHDAALAAGAVILSHYDGEVRVEMKAPGDPVTVADRESNQLIVDALGRAFPDDAILAEESPVGDFPGSSGAGGGSGADRRWCVDPLDGTKEFLAKNGEFAVMIGLAVQGRAVLGVVYQPAIDLLLEGVVGVGAWITSRSDRRPASVSTTSDPASMRLVVSRSHRSPLVDAAKAALRISAERISGSVGVKIALLARQEADLYIHPGRGVKLWDACAPEAILVAAGGKMTDTRGQLIRYDSADPALDRGLIASNAQAHEAIVAALAGATDAR